MVKAIAPTWRIFWLSDRLLATCGECSRSLTSHRSSLDRLVSGLPRVDVLQLGDQLRLDVVQRFRHARFLSARRVIHGAEAAGRHRVDALNRHRRTHVRTLTERRRQTSKGLLADACHDLRLDRATGLHFAREGAVHDRPAGPKRLVRAPIGRHAVECRKLIERRKPFLSSVVRSVRGHCHDQVLGVKHLSTLTHHLIDVKISVTAELEAGVAEAVLGSDMDGIEGVALKTVHRVSTWLEREVIDLAVGQQVADATRLGGPHGITAVLLVPEGSDAVLRQPRHANLQRLARIVCHGGPVGLRIRDVDVPLEAVLRVAQHMRYALRTQRLREAIVQVVDLLLEGLMRGRLHFRILVARARVLASPEAHLEGGTELQQSLGTAQQLGCAARFQHQLVRVHEQARLREHVSVERLAGPV
mmetsp:Transcript_3501/g.5949  ORF Transcript_3501/g.5949 Transcript_3501/m.5949 type:complete len:416 (-) Transcript_3501:595-1842(-)